MTRREFMVKSAGAAAVAAGTAGLSGSAAKAVVVEAPRIDGIWPYCNHWRAWRYPPAGRWWFIAWFQRGVPLKTFKAFLEDGGEVSSLPLPILDLHAFWLLSLPEPIDLSLNAYYLEPQLNVLFQNHGDWPFGPARSLDMTPRRLVMR